MFTSEVEDKRVQRQDQVHKIRWFVKIETTHFWTEKAMDLCGRLEL